MSIPNGLKLLALGIALAGATLGHASATTPSTSCASLAAMQIENTTLTEAVEVPAGQPLQMGGAFGPPTVLKSLPAHCLVHGEVNHHQGANGKEYGDKFEIRMPLSGAAGCCSRAEAAWTGF